jgi:hypothetical protein
LRNKPQSTLPCHCFLIMIAMWGQGHLFLLSVSAHLFSSLWLQMQLVLFVVWFVRQIFWKIWITACICFPLSNFILEVNHSHYSLVITARLHGWHMSIIVW